ncbi:MAG: hypothetical protein WBM51_12830, partial [Pseudolabrys sp.]
PLRQKLLPLTGRRDLILTVCPKKMNQGDNVDKTLAWFMRMWGAFVDIWRERRLVAASVAPRRSHDDGFAEND